MEEKKKKRYKIISELASGIFAERKMNELAEEGYRFVGMSTAGTQATHYITIIMEKVD